MRDKKLCHDKVCHQGYELGAWVWLSNPTRLATHWKGNYWVIQVVASGVVAAMMHHTINPLDLLEKTQVVHHNTVKWYTLLPETGSDTPSNPESPAPGASRTPQSPLAAMDWWFGR